MASEALANPWLWLGLGGFFLGLALGEGLLWAQSVSRQARGRARSIPSALAGAGLALALLAVAGLLVLPSKPELSSALAGAPALVWTIAFLALGFLLAALPLVGGGLILALAIAAGFFAGPVLSSWLPFTPGQDLARLLPFGQAGETWSCELIIYQKDSVPTTSRLDLLGADAGLVVESLAFTGPASLFRRGTLYRIVGLVSAQGKVLAAFPGTAAALDLLLPLPPGLGRGQKGSFILRSRDASPSLGLVALEPLIYGLGEAGEDPPRPTARVGQPRP